MNFESLERRTSARLGPRNESRWHGLDRPSWRSFFVALVALAAGLFLALYTGAAARVGHIFLVALSGSRSLPLAGLVALPIVPVLAGSSPLAGVCAEVPCRRPAPW